MALNCLSRSLTFLTADSMRVSACSPSCARLSRSSVRLTCPVASWAFAMSLVETSSSFGAMEAKGVPATFCSTSRTEASAAARCVET